MNERIESAEEEVGSPDIGPGRVVRALGYSIHGLAAAWRSEGAFRQEVICAVVLIPIALLAPATLVERVLLVGSVLFVLVVELLNSALEAAIDRISAERHPLSKKAKDAGSAAVFVAIIAGTLTWFAILGPWLLGLLGR
jgi:diacylglycerol kinase (ATP)